MYNFTPINKIMKYLFTFIITCCMLTAWADGMFIKGNISDIDTKQPLKVANVQISFFQGFTFSDLTDSLGKYEIKTTAIVPEGYYGIEIEAKDYYKLNGFIHVTKDCTFDFSLKSKTPKLILQNAQLDTVKPLPVKVNRLEGYATNNLIFLIDVSSSMNAPDKMPALKASMKYLVNELRPTDKVAIMTFSNTAKEILASTEAEDKMLIYKTIDELSFGSTTQGGIALNEAYKTAQKNFIQNGNNRIVLASDGVFSSGEKEYKKMQQIISTGTQKKISLSIFCFGKNTDYVKSKLQKLATLGNGNFANITTIEEGEQHMLEEAKAVKKMK